MRVSFTKLYDGHVQEKKAQAPKDLKFPKFPNLILFCYGLGAGDIKDPTANSGNNQFIKILRGKVATFLYVMKRGQQGNLKIEV